MSVSRKDTGVVVFTSEYQILIYSRCPECEVGRKPARPIDNITARTPGKA